MWQQNCESMLLWVAEARSRVIYRPHPKHEAHRVGKQHGYSMTHTSECKSAKEHQHEGREKCHRSETLKRKRLIRVCIPNRHGTGGREGHCSVRAQIGVCIRAPRTSRRSTPTLGITHRRPKSKLDAGRHRFEFCNKGSPRRQVAGMRPNCELSPKISAAKEP